MVAVSRYSATVHREGNWWVIDVEGVGATQAKRLDKVEYMARDLVAAVRDIDAETVQVDVRFDLAPELANLLEAARVATIAADEARQKATDLSRTAAARLRSEKWSLRDIARLIGVSFQRVDQLLAEAAAVTARRVARAAAASTTTTQIVRHPDTSVVDRIKHSAKQQDDRDPTPV